MELYYSLAGFVVGLLVGLTGIGGGALMTPVLIVVFGIPVITAVSTDLLYAAITKCGGVVNYYRQRMINWKVVVLMLSGSLPGSWITLNYLSELDNISDIESLINTVLGISLILTSVAVFVRSKIQRLSSELATAGKYLWLGKFRPSITVVTGLGLGVLVSLSSVGAGALGTALLICCYPRMKMPEIVGTDLLHAVILTTVAGVGHYSMGSVDLSLLLYLIIGSLPGVLIGSYYGVKLSANIMQPVMGTVLMVIGGHFIFSL
ncbi:MAG: sulfite exporter TauE/SafE family protein [Pseudomonadales bacterium]|nr:sulfite exporter TauE/SafE family protein [Pseudomonadales bacterium]NRA17196.1 sulfite exporter TauE/SafE family protein [Oceanospirillaceae bacterium]